MGSLAVKSFLLNSMLRPKNAGITAGDTSKIQQAASRRLRSIGFTVHMDQMIGLPVSYSTTDYSHSSRSAGLVVPGIHMV